MTFFGRPPTGFSESPMRSSDCRPADLDRIRTALDRGERLDVGVAHKRKRGPQSPNFVVYRYTGCMTKAGVGAVTPSELRALAGEYGFAAAWWVRDQPLIVSRAVWYRAKEWYPGKVVMTPTQRERAEW